MYRSGEHDVATIARVLGVSRASVYRGLALTDAGKWWKKPAMRDRLDAAIGSGQ